MTSHVTDALIDDEDSCSGEESDAQDTEPEIDLDVEERVAVLEERIKELESDLAAARHEGRWTEGELRRLIREELDNVSANSKEHDGSQSQDAKLDLLSKIDGVGPSIIDRLEECGYQTAADVKTASVSELTAIDRIGETLATRMLEQTRKYA